MRAAVIPQPLTTEPFSRDRALTLGLTDSALQSPPWRHVFLGVWAHRDVPESREFRLAAVKLVLPPHAVLCGLTAAWLHGIDVRREDDLDVHVSFPRGKRLRNRPGMVVTQETLAVSDWTAIDGVRVTTALRTAFDCLRLLSWPEGVVVADAMTHAGLVKEAELRTYFAGKRRLRNLRRGEALLDEVDPKAESPMETRMRLRMTSSGLPRPEAQYVVRTPTGGFVARVDLAYPAVRLAIEYDGAWHWQQRRADDRRRARLRALGWEVLVYDADDVFKAPDAMCAEIARALRTRRQAG